MKLNASVILKNRSIFYIIIGGLLPMAYIIFLLTFNYRNNLALHEASKKRFQLDVENRAKTLEYFFLEKKYNLRSIADSPEVHIYFTNRAMGMSEQYGLKVSLFYISRLMQKTIQNGTIKGKPVYKQLAFLDKNRKILVNSASFMAQPVKTKSIHANMDDAIKEPNLIIEKTGGNYELLLATPCFFNQRVSGWIVAWLDLDVLYQFFLKASLEMSSTTICLTLENGDIIGPPNSGLQNFFQTISREKITTAKDMELVTANNLSGGSDVILLTRLQIQTLPLYLTVFIERNELLGQVKGWQFLTGTGAIIFIILLAVILLAGNNTKHLILETRFEASEKQQGRLIKKNKQLKNEILKRQKAELILRINEERYRNLFESSSDAILIVKDNQITDCNQKTVELLGLGRNQIINRTFDAFFPDKQPNGSNSKQTGMEKLERALQEPQSFEWTLKTENNRLIETEIDMTALLLDSNRCIQVIIRDITERNRAQEIMVQTEKMAAVGELATGMAHEINNPLGIILMSAQNINRRLGTDMKRNRETALSIGLDFEKFQVYLREKSIFNYVRAIQSAGERAAKIVKSMLDFGRDNNELKKEPCRLNELMDQAIEMASNDYDMKKNFDFKKIAIHRHYTDTQEVKCEKTEIIQVLLNIIKNAAQAMAGQADRNDSPRLDVFIGQKNNRVIIEIMDNGPGIKKEIQKTIFQPFFTTKPVGEGTGLGLSVSYFIISTHHNGLLRVESKEGSGSKFTIELETT